MARVTIEDLRFAAEWMRAYEADEADTLARCKRLAEWLDREADKREGKASATLLEAYIKLARTHKAADAACGRDWTCACAACREVRRRVKG